MATIQVATGDKTRVQETWKNVYTDWDNENGVTFYARLHAKYPDIKVYFDKLGPRTAEDKQKQAARAGRMFQSWIENLGNREALSERIAGMVQSHLARGVKDVSLYQQFFDELILFIGDTIGLTSAQQTAWKNITALFLEQIEADLL